MASKCILMVMIIFSCSNGVKYRQRIEKKPIWLQEKNREPLSELSEGQLMLSSVLHNMALASSDTAAAAPLLVLSATMRVA